MSVLKYRGTFKTPEPGETVTIMNQPGTVELRALVHLCFRAHEEVCIGETWLSNEVRDEIIGWFERIYSHAATQIHAGLWKMPRKVRR